MFEYWKKTQKKNQYFPFRPLLHRFPFQTEFISNENYSREVFTIVFVERLRIFTAQFSRLVSIIIFL